MKKMNSIGLSVATAMFLGMTGCSKSNDSDTSNLNTKPVNDVTPAVDDNNTTKALAPINTVNGKAVDGYLRYSIVCLDLNQDSFCQPTEPFALTDINGSFTLNIRLLAKLNISTIHTSIKIN